MKDSAEIWAVIQPLMDTEKNVLGGASPLSRQFRSKLTLRTPNTTYLQSYDFAPGLRVISRIDDRSISAFQLPLEFPKYRSDHKLPARGTESRSARIEVR